jgi:ABC-type dipeptide/oligopeptide/nickel transport system ATPase component
MILNLDANWFLDCDAQKMERVLLNVIGNSIKFTPQGGEIWLKDMDLIKLDEKGIQSVRWERISLIMQGAMNSLNPTMRVRDQIIDVIVAHHRDGISLILNNTIR